MSVISRRQALGSALLLASFPSFPAEETEDDPPEADVPDYADATLADAWVKQWEVSQRAVNGALTLLRFADPTYVVLKEISWAPNPPDAARFKPVTVPKGFVTDFASIPRAFWSALRPDGPYVYAAIVHDYLYWNQPVDRKTADQVMRLTMRDFSISSAIIGTIYRALRIGGGGAWRANAKRKEAGEKRVLQKYPEDPTIKWEDWKKRPDVFA